MKRKRAISSNICCPCDGQSKTDARIGMMCRIKIGCGEFPAAGTAGTIPVNRINAITALRFKSNVLEDN